MTPQPDTPEDLLFELGGEICELGANGTKGMTDREVELHVRGYADILREIADSMDTPKGHA